MKFDFKVTAWERVEVGTTELEEKVLKGIKDGTINSASDIFDLITDDAHCDKLDDTDEQMTPEENGGASTIEVMDDEGKVIHQNGW